jgi:hypothetical protein
VVVAMPIVVGVVVMMVVMNFILPLSFGTPYRRSINKGEAIEGKMKAVNAIWDCRIIFDVVVLKGGGIIVHDWLRCIHLLIEKVGGLNIGKI